MLGDGSLEAAGATAAYKALVGLYGATAPCLASVSNPELTYAGDPAVAAGVAAAAALLPLKRPTFMLPFEPFIGGNKAGEWRLTPGVTAAANSFMAFTPPFAILRPAQFRAGPPYSLSSHRYLRDYNEVKAKGRATGSTRTDAETDLARFWSANFIAQWFAVARTLADAHVDDLGKQARLLALVAFAAADSQITVYDSKVAYNFWRPITAIQMGDDDGNPWTEGEPTWTSLIAAPPYSDWTSGANNITAAVTTIFQQYFRTDSMQFSVSSSAAGLTTNPRKFERFSQAQQEVVEARIFQGIHFRAADEEGRRQGTRVAVWTFNNVLRPVPQYANRHKDFD
jgi:hypothetical protein